MTDNNAIRADAFCNLARAVIETEAKVVASLAERIDVDFALACQHLLACTGRIVVVGMGKSGHIANKIAATLASTGSPAFFVHAGEASHGDLGMITKQDVVIAISNSGTTRELVCLLPLLKRLGVTIISLTGNPQSTIAQAATVNLDVSVDNEACPLGLAPTSSTTATLVMGDALAIALLDARGFTRDDFALSHPGGALGRRLLLRVKELMASGEQLPLLKLDTDLSQALLSITEKRLGIGIIVDKDHKLLGIFTDGDLRRTIESGRDVYHISIGDCMTAQPKTIHQNLLAAEALNIMESHKITSLVVTDDDNTVVGLVHMHAILSAEMQ